MADVSSPPVSVIIRAMNKVNVIREAIGSVREQSVPAEVIVVDSGSTDGTLEVAQAAADRVVRLPQDSFTFGGALNRGAEVASAPVHAALSSHCRLPHRGWLARALELLEDRSVAAVSGHRFLPDGSPLSAAVRLDSVALGRHPLWSLSNHASAWRADAWQHCPFDEQLAASEDRLFARQLTDRGWVVVIDPVLWVPAAHRKSSGLRSLYARRRLEVNATARALDLPNFRVRDAARWWWSDVSREPGTRFPMARLDPRRLAALAGIVAGYRDAGRLGNRSRETSCR